MDYSQVIKESLHEELQQFDTYLRESIRTDNQRIQNIVNHVFKSKGKHVRPILVLLAAKSCGGITPATFHGAVTVELLHTATLIHDDVVDESKVRRDQPSVGAIFDNKRAVLCGDYFLSSALRESVKTENIEIVDIIAQLGQNLSEGELNQYSLANEMIIDEEEYFNVINEKTASLLYACTKIGAITAGADRLLIDEFGELGRLLGVCFQIRDDIFDYYKTDVGKPTGNDIREGKITLPLLHALQHAPQDESMAMKNIISQCDYSSENIEKLISFAKQYNGIDYAYAKIEELLLQAEAIINRFSIHKETKELLFMLLLYLKNRTF